MKKFLILLLVNLLSVGYAQTDSSSSFHFDSSDKELASSVNWAKNRALLYSYNGTDPVGYWYMAAFPNREAFCMRDVSHQSIGAEILGLGPHNLNMVVKFCQNISESKNFATYWEINRYNNPAPVDYENDQDFWYNLPSNFDLIYAIKRMYDWTENTNYIQDNTIENFISLSLNEYVDEWEISSDKVTLRDRFMYVQKQNEFPNNRFGNTRGIPTYYERGSMLSLLGIDLTASYIAALKSQVALLKQRKAKKPEIERYKNKLENEINFLNTYWWDESKNAFKSILYEDLTFDYYSVGKDEALLHFLIYFDVLEDLGRMNDIMDWYSKNQQKLIIELKSYLPIFFYQYGYSSLANKMIKELCHENNKRRDYPEISFTVIEHVSRGLMGIDVNPNYIETMSRLEKDQKWASVDGVSIKGTMVGVKHFGKKKTIVENQGQKKLDFKIKFEGKHNCIEVNEQNLNATTEVEKGKTISYVLVSIEPSEKIEAEVF